MILLTNVKIYSKIGTDITEEKEKTTLNTKYVGNNNNCWPGSLLTCNKKGRRYKTRFLNVQETWQFSTTIIIGMQCCVGVEASLVDHCQCCSVRRYQFFYFNVSYCYRIKSKIVPNDWLFYGWATFQIYSRYAAEGTPIQYRDIVAFKYPIGGYTAWLYHYSGRFYSRGCSYYKKAACAAENTTTGFRIFKKLWSDHVVTKL